MRRNALAALLLVLAAATLAAEAPARIRLEAHDVEGHPLAGLRFAVGPTAWPPTDSQGVAEIALPANLHAGQQIKVSLQSSPNPLDEWFLVNPNVNVPNSADAVALVLMRRSDFRRLAEKLLDDAHAPGRAAAPTPEDRSAAIKAAAAQFGLNSTQLESSIRSFSETQDLRDLGIASYMRPRHRRENLRA
jgi:hypothetical protein